MFAQATAVVVLSDTVAVVLDALTFAVNVSAK